MSNKLKGNRLSSFSIRQLAMECLIDWGGWARVHYSAKPYLSAMMDLTTVRDRYGFDSGKSIVLYFLSNAQSWRGEVARAVKAELKRRVK